MKDIATNLGKTKSEIIYEIMLSLCKGNSGYFGASPRIDLAQEYYNELVEREIICELPF